MSQAVWYLKSPAMLSALLVTASPQMRMIRTRSSVVFIMFPPNKKPSHLGRPLIILWVIFLTGRNRGHLLCVISR